MPITRGLISDRDYLINRKQCREKAVKELQSMSAWATFNLVPAMYMFNHIYMEGHFASRVVAWKENHQVFFLLKAFLRWSVVPDISL